MLVPEEQGDDAHQGESMMHLSAQDQTLLNALHAFVAPYIEQAKELKNRTQSNDVDQTVSRPEAAFLITELKKFISRIITGSSEISSLDQTKIEVRLDEDLEGDCGKEPNFSESDEIIVDEEKEEILVRGNNKDQAHNTVHQSKVQHVVPKATIKEQFGMALRDHVFNKMPIRLLFFEKHGSSLNIRLLERSAILTMLGAKLRCILEKQDPAWDLSEIATKDDEYRIRNLITSHADYGILSHTWIRSLPGEVTYGDWATGYFNRNNPGYQKLVKFCKVAFTDHGLSFGWIDTVCINKNSSSELDESIRSMYDWYQRAKICIIYLSETIILSHMHRDPWFTRGWTLQELLAPNAAKFYNKNWKKLVQDSINDKPSMQYAKITTESPEIVEQITKATTLTQHELVGIRGSSLSRRMQLAARREVTREEDTAYSLMGIFKVSMTTAYGEGANRAFSRLLQEILNSTSVGILELFNWDGYIFNSSISRILPLSPRQYLVHSSSVSLRIQPLEPLTLTHAGIRIPVLLMPGISSQIDKEDRPFKASGDYSATVTISPASLHRELPTTYRLLDNRACDRDGRKSHNPGTHQYTFAVLNAQMHSDGIRIPRTCIAMPIRCYESVGKVTSIGSFSRIFTHAPVVFKMQQKETPQADTSVESYVDVGEDGVVLAPDELSKHGMQLVIKYL